MIRLRSDAASLPAGALAYGPFFLHVFRELLTMSRAAAVIFALLFVCGIAAALAHAAG
jgi:hypothetical protein